MSTTTPFDWMTPGVAGGAHPVAAAVARLRGELDDLLDTSVWSMGAEQTARVLGELTALAAQVAGLELKVAAHADRVGAGDGIGATTTAAWWAGATKQTRAVCHRKVKLAAALDGEHEPVGDALAEGRLQPDQAQVIVDAVDALPPRDIDPEVRAEARRHLIGAARDHDAKALKVLGRRVLEVVAPDIAEGHEAKLLEAEETRAAASARFTMSEDGHGRVHGRFTLSSLHGAMLRTQLDALLHAQDTETSAKPLPHRRGLALTEWIERYPVEKLPRTGGGVAATVVVTLTIDSLMGGLEAAGLSTGGRISAAQARRLACEAGIIPAVLGGKSQVLDLGRKRRFHTEAQRIALMLRDGPTCTGAGCDRPASQSHAHHDQAWTHGGATNLTNGRLLCLGHHLKAHDPRYTHTIRPDNTITFHRRT
jgi:hypothetical protein